MSTRRKARELALQMLYLADQNSDADARMIRALIGEQIEDDDLRDFAWSLFAGTMEHRAEIDQKIEAVAQNWTISRMAITDRNALRLGCFEMHYTLTPAKVIVDEAVEIAKSFGNANSPSFVNGILDKLIPKQ